MSTTEQMPRLGFVPQQQLPVKDLEPACAPVIDLSHLRQHFNQRSVVIEDIGRACHSPGCFQVINHGINKAVIEDALEAASNFFELSAEEKAEYASDDLSKPVRFSATSNDGISKERAVLKHYAHPLSEWIQFWPLTPPDYREKMGKYAMEVRRVALQLMEAILESLGLDQSYLKDELDVGMQVMAVNCYPPWPQPGLVLGLAPHSDYGYITIILQSCQGLHVMDRDGESWRGVPEVSETLHVHIGDYLEVLSNGRYKSVMHRAVLNSEKRISVASIHGLSMDEKVVTAKELVDENHPTGYMETSFRDFLNYLITTDISRERSFIDSLKIFRA